MLLHFFLLLLAQHVTFVRPFSSSTTPRRRSARHRPFGWKVHAGQEKSELAGAPVSPTLPKADGGGGSKSVIIRYIFDGGKLARDARLVTAAVPFPSSSPSDSGVVVVVTAADVLAALRRDGVDLDVFYATAYETEESGGAWVRLDPEGDAQAAAAVSGAAGSRAEAEAGAEGGAALTFTLPAEDATKRPRIDVKLFRRQALAAKGALEHSGFFAMGIVGAKTTQNIGSLWRSAYQLGASYIFTVGARYAKTQATDTLVAHKRMPCFEFDDWPAFAQADSGAGSSSESSSESCGYSESTATGGGRRTRGGGLPRGAQLVAVEMGGEPLETFVHPPRAVYLLGSEDTGLAASVVAAAHHHVALPAVRYESFNVAMAGSIVLYDRLAKQQQQQQQKEQEQEQQGEGEGEGRKGGGHQEQQQRRRRGSGSSDERATDDNYDCSL